jgi:hypothetical protein
MKKILTGLVIAIMVSLGFSTIALGDPPEYTFPDGWDYEVSPLITTEVTVATGGGTPPIVKCKWETVVGWTDPTVPDWWLDDDDTALGIQINPVPAGLKRVYYWAVVHDNPLDDILLVVVDVYHPDGAHKYQFDLPNIITDPNHALACFENVTIHNDDIITYGLIPGGGGALYDATEVMTELQQGEAWIYWGWADISYCQPAGDYTVRTVAMDVDGETELINHFWYVPHVGVQYDFTNVNYARDQPVPIQTWQMLPGDIDMSTNTHATARNIGNTPVQFEITQDDMDFGTHGTPPEPNVMYRARLGDATGGNTYVEYPPDTPSIIPKILPLCTEDKFDFWIWIYKRIDNADYYDGEMSINASMVVPIGTGYPTTPGVIIGPTN